MEAHSSLSKDLVTLVGEVNAISQQAAPTARPFETPGRQVVVQADLLKRVSPRGVEDTLLLSLA